MTGSLGRRSRPAGSRLELGNGRELIAQDRAEELGQRIRDPNVLAPLLRDVSEAGDAAYRPLALRGTTASWSVVRKPGFVRGGRKRKSVGVRGRCMERVLFGR